MTFVISCPLQPHGFELSSGFDRIEGEVKTTALFKTMWLQSTDMTETSRDYLKFPLNGSDAKRRIHLMGTLGSQVKFQKSGKQSASLVGLNSNVT